MADLVKPAAVLAAATLLLGGCGLRGGLERPPPLLGGEGEAASVEAVPDPEDEESEFVQEAPEEDAGPRLNELGGEIPDTAPVEDVNEGGLDEVAPADDG